MGEEGWGEFGEASRMAFLSEWYVVGDRARWEWRRLPPSGRISGFQRHWGEPPAMTLAWSPGLLHKAQEMIERPNGEMPPFPEKGL